MLLQFPVEGASEVLCRGCGVDWRGVYSAVFDRCADSGDGGYHLADIPAGVWRGWVFDDWPQDYAAREFGGGASQARISVDGQ